MIVIDDGATFARALNTSTDPALCRLLSERLDQLLADTGGEYELAELARLIVVAPGDTVEAVERAAEYPVASAPAFEWAIDHGGWLEAVTVLSDSGSGVVLFVPNVMGVCAPLLNVLRDHISTARSKANKEQNMNRQTGDKTAP